MVSAKKRGKTVVASLHELDAGPYALALKAIAESRFDEARSLLGEAEKAKEIELARIYQARGETESFAVRYVDAVSWYRKALSLRPADPGLLNGMASALMHAGDYVAVEPLYQQALAIQEKALGADHPEVAQSLDNLAALYGRKGQYVEAEPLHRRALAIREKVLGLDHPEVAESLNRYVALLRKMGQEAEAARMEARAKAILEKGSQESQAK